MKLSFRARAGGLVSIPGEVRFVGSLPRYVGRSPITVQTDAGATTGYPADAEPYECDSDSEDGRRLTKRCKRGELWPADAETARHCSVPFVDLALVDGEWIPRPKERSAPSKGASRSASATSEN